MNEEFILNYQLMSIVGKLYDIVSIKECIDEVHKIRIRMKGVADEDDELCLSNYIREIVHREAVEAWYSSGKRGAILAATGVGKTKIAIDIMTRLFSKIITPNILLVVPTEKLRDEGWKNEIDKWGVSQYWPLIKRCCYVSLNKYKDEEFHLVILDEGHNITESNAKFFSQNVSPCVLWLSATRPRDLLKKTLLKSLGINPVYELTISEAVKLGLVAPYDVTIITTYLDNGEKYLRGGTKTKSFPVTEKKKYTYLSNLVFKKPGKMNRLNRMRFIYDLRTKTNAAKLILEHVIPKNLRGLIFCGSKEQAEAVCENYFHSGTNDKALNLFKQKQINRLSCVEALNEGQNIDDLDFAFMVQINSNPLDIRQRIGRVIRYRPGHIGRIVILCLEDSIDKEWVEQATYGLSENIRTVELLSLRTGLEEIKF